MRLGATSLSVTKPGSARQYAAASGGGGGGSTTLPDIDTYSHVRFDLINTSTNDAFDCQISPDGTKFYTLHKVTSTVALLQEQSLSTAYDISTHGSVTASLSTYTHQPNGQCYTFAFADNGSKLYLGGVLGDVTHLELSTPWDLSSTVTSVRMVDVGQRVNGIFWKPDGTVLYYADDFHNKLFAKTVSTPWDLSTITSTASSVDLSSTEQIPNDVYFSGDGLKLFVLGYYYDKVYQYDLSTAWDITSFTVTPDKELSIVAQETSPWGFTFSNDGTHMYIAGGNGNGVDQYTTS